MKENPSLRRWLYLAAPLPALAIGAMVMRHAGLPPSIWGQNVAAGLVLTAVCAFLPTVAGPRSKPFPWNVLTFAVLGLLLATFANAGLEGVHRWVKAGPLRFYASATCLPALILALGAKLCLPNTGRLKSFVPLVGGGALGLVAVQPDAAQATAFTGAWLTLLLFNRERTRVLAFAVIAAGYALDYAWTLPDPLMPVPHVEGIVGMAARISMLWQASALLALALLPLPFLFFGWSGRSPTALTLGIYFSLCLLAPLVGAFPVPVMGFGLSPIIGYSISLGWLVMHERRTEN